MSMHELKEERGTIATVVRRPVTVAMVILALGVVGLLAALRIPLKLIPGGEGSKVVTVMVPLRDYGPRETEEKVARPLEEALRTVRGVSEISSRSDGSMASLRVAFENSMDLGLAKAEVRDRVERARVDLPEDVDRIFVWAFNLDDGAPVIMAAMTFASRDARTQELLDDVIEPYLTGVDGVARVQVWGGRDRTVRVQLDEERVRDLGIDIGELVQRFRTENFAEPAGRLRDGDREFLLRVDARLETLERIEALPIRPGLLLGDVAKVVYEQGKVEWVSRVNGQDSFFCSISKVSDANTVEVCERVNRALAELHERADLNGFDYRTILDQGVMIKASIRSLGETAVYGAAIAIGVLWLFLRHLRMTLLIALAIPVSLTATLVWLWGTGDSFNLLTMMGITLALGMLVDNAVVVVENIYRRREMGEGAFLASVRGAREMGLAITLATLTTVAVFAPLMFMTTSPMFSMVFGGIGVPVCTSLIASLFAALWLIPAAGARLVGDDRSGRGFSSTHGFTALLARWNERWVGWVLRHRILALLLAIASAASIQPASQLTKRAVQQQLQEPSITIELGFQKNFTLEDSDRVARSYEALLEPHKARLGINNVSVRIRRAGEGQLKVFFPDQLHPDRHAEILEDLKKVLPPRPGVALSFPSSDNEFQRGSAEGLGRVGIRIQGPDSTRVSEIAREIEQRLELHPDLDSVETSLMEGRQEVRVAIDRSESANAAVSPDAVARTVQWGLSGFQVARIPIGGNEIPLILEYGKNADDDLQRLEDMQVFSAGGGSQRLGAFATFEAEEAPSSISRRNGRASVSVSARVREGADQSVGWKAMAEVMREVQLPPGYVFEEAGGMQQFQTDMRSMMEALMVGIILVYLLMGILFESWLLPISIVLTLPFAFAGAYWSLVLCNVPQDIVAMIGLVILVGIVVNNGVVLIDHINRVRSEAELRGDTSMTRTRATLDASSARLRPILMTTLTTVAGLLPSALDGQPPRGGVSYQTLAITVIGGLSVATLFTLWVVPLLYTLIDDFSIAMREAVLSWRSWGIFRLKSGEAPADATLASAGLDGVSTSPGRVPPPSGT
ncbi:MAG: efflux RND transporter permease subunit [Planctomycetes bacterium]|nr:efflux RND transporter permease subunit [Planctomycetota bacterium]